jgi:hypothetical protein
MITVGSITREQASRTFNFLADVFPGRRTAIRDLTHGAPEFVFWIYPDGRLHDARRSHRANLPRGHEHIVDDEPDYGGFLRGRVVRYAGYQLVVVYCRAEALATATPSLRQLLTGLDQMPMPIDESALVVSDNADIYGTFADLWERTYSTERFTPQIVRYLEMFRSGNADDAFHGLLESDHDILPELMAVFRSEQDGGVREFLVRVIWKLGERSVIPFLGEVLSDNEALVWRQALDGLVSLATPAALDVLRAARARQFATQREAEEFRRWLEEAIEHAGTEGQSG